MPELPEVENIRYGIKPYLINKVILYIIVRNYHLKHSVSNEIFTLKNEFILGVHRRAKYLLFKLRNGWIIIHLGMSGSLRLFFEDLPIKKHDHIDIIINNGSILRYSDPRRFGLWLWTKDIKNHKLFTKLGPEPLSKNFNPEYLQKKCINKRKPIKVLLMDSKFVVGIGNIYANESLFRSGIHPSKAAFSISKLESIVLVRSIKYILQKAINLGGTTIRNFVRSDGKLGYFNNELTVYNRHNKLCKICKTPIISFICAQRITFYCCYCQN